MAVNVCNGVIVVDCGDGPVIGFSAYIPSMRLYIGGGGILLANPENIGVSGNAPGCRFEVQSDGGLG
jgi:hypothetical protein